MIFESTPNLETLFETIPEKATATCEPFLYWFAQTPPCIQDILLKCTSERRDWQGGRRQGLEILRNTISDTTRYPWHPDYRSYATRWAQYEESANRLVEVLIGGWSDGVDQFNEKSQKEFDEEFIICSGLFYDLYAHNECPCKPKNHCGLWCLMSLKTCASIGTS